MSRKIIRKKRKIELFIAPGNNFTELKQIGGEKCDSALITPLKLVAICYWMIWYKLSDDDSDTLMAL